MIRPGVISNLIPMQRRCAAGLLVAVAAFSIAVLSTSAATDSDPLPPTKELRDCRTRGEGGGPQRLPVPPGVRIGPLAIWPSVRGDSSPTYRRSWPFVVKAPIVLPARAKVVLAIAPEAIYRAAFQSHRYGWVSAVRFHACREREPAFAYRGTVGKFTGFPFAIGLKRRSACIPMEVWVEGETTPIRRLVPIGRRSC
jgi:hypothetical protein